MAVNQAVTLHLSEKQRKILESMKKGTHSPLHLIQRATIILMAADNLSNKEIARQTGWNRNTVKQWRNRWAKVAVEINHVETDKPWTLPSFVDSMLQDEYRPGKPSKFTSEQVAHIIKIALDKPEEHDVPYTHWTPSALAREAVKDGIVQSISSRQVGRFLKRSGFEASPQSVLVESEDKES
jgi:putative transposase